MKGITEIENLPLPLKKEGIEDKLAKICEDNGVIFLAIFGSFVRGEQRKKSDIDIAIEFDKNKRKSLLDLVHLEYELSEMFKRKVALGIFSSISPYIIDDVKKEMRVIYEKR
jgi:predicted nucleotidyltransferase